MFGSGGWTKDPMELLRWQLLPWMADQPENQPDTRPFLEGRNVSERDLGAVVRALRNEGLARKYQRMAPNGPTVAVITEEGYAAARGITVGRQNRARRGVAAQEALLDWVYEDQQGPEPTRELSAAAFLGDIRAHFLGDPLRASEIRKAAQSLHERGDIDGVMLAEFPEPLTLMLTDTGRAIVERGGVLHADQGGMGQTFHNTFNAPVNAVAQGSRFQQVQTTYGVDPAALGESLRAVSAALGELDEDDRDRASRALVTIEDDAHDGFPEPSAVRRRLATLRAIAEGTASASTFVVAVTQLADILGPVLH